MKTILFISVLIMATISLAKVENLNSLIRQSAQEQAVAYRNLDRYFGFSHRVMLARNSNAESRGPANDSEMKIRLIQRK